MFKTKRAVFFGCYFAFFVNGVLVLGLGAIMPLVAHHLGMNYQMVGLAVAAPSLGNLLCNLLTGILPRYLGQKRSVLLLSLGGVVGTLGIMLTSNQWLCVIFFFLTGIGRASTTYITNSIVNNHSAGDPAPLNVLHSFFAVGALAVPIFVSICVINGLTFQFVQSVVAVLLSMTLLIYALMPMNEPVAAKKADAQPRSLLYFLRNTEFIVTVILIFFYLGMETGVNGWLVTYLLDSGAMPAGLAQFMLSILWALILVGRLICAYLSRFVRRNTLLICMAASVMLFFGLFLVSKTSVMLIFSIAGVGISMGGIYPTAVSNVGKVIAGSTTGMVTLLALSNSGGILMPYVSGLISEAAGIYGGMVFVGMSTILLLACSVWNAALHTGKATKERVL